MEKSSWALVIAIAAAGFSFWQAYSGHVVAKISKASSRRKAPVFEVAPSSMPDHPGWYRLTVTARNFEQVNLRVTSVKSKCNDTRLLGPEAVSYEETDDYGAPMAVYTLDQQSAKKVCVIDQPLGVAGQSSSHSESVIHFTIFATAAAQAKDLSFQWTWADDYR